MLRTWIFLGSAVLCLSSDDQSLMQQGVGIEARTTAFQSSMRQISSLLDQDGLNEVNKRVLTTMLGSMLDATELEGPDEVTVRRCQELLRSILIDLVLTAKKQNLEFEGFLGAIKECLDGDHGAFSKHVRETEANVITTEQAHGKSRGELKIITKRVFDQCQPLLEGLMDRDNCQRRSVLEKVYFDTFKKDWFQPLQIDSIVNKGLILLDSHIKSAKNWVDAVYEDATNVLDVVVPAWKDDCKEAQQLYEPKSKEAVLNQRMFESAVCQAHVANVQLCRVKEYCYDNEKGDYMVFKDLFSKESELRVFQARILHFVICLLDTTLIDEGDEATEKARIACGTVEEPVGFVPDEYLFNPGGIVPGIGECAAGISDRYPVFANEDEYFYFHEFWYANKPWNQGSFLEHANGFCYVYYD